MELKGSELAALKTATKLAIDRAGGACALEEVLGRRHSVISGYANPNCADAFMPLNLVALLQRHNQDVGISRALSRLEGHATVANEFHYDTPEDLKDGVLECTETVGKVAAAIREMDEDGIRTNGERRVALDVTVKLRLAVEALETQLRREIGGET